MLVAVLIGIASPFAPAARADASSTKTSSLAWLRLPGSEVCVAAQDLARAVETRLGREVFVPTSRADLSIEGRVEPIASGEGKGGHRATILVRGASGETLGERTIDEKDPRCAALTEPLALVIALMIDPDAATRPAEPRTAAPTPPPPASASAPPPPPPPVVLAPKPEGLRFEGTLVSTLVTGMTPGVALGFGGAALLQLPRVPISLRGSGAIHVPVEAERGGVSSAFDLGLLSGYVCPTAVLGERVRLLACLGSQVGVVRARALRPFVSDDDYRVLGNVAAEGRAAVQIVGPLVVTASAGAAVGIFRKDLRLDRAPGATVVVHEMAPVSFLGELGLGVIVP